MSDSFEWPSRFLDLKRQLVSATTEECLTTAWHEVLAELAKRTAEIVQTGPDFIHKVNFEDLEKLTPEEIDVIRRKGSVVIRNVVDYKTACGWKAELDEYIDANPNAPGLNKQFLLLYWTRPQVQARAHPNILKAAAWLNNLYHVGSGKKLEGADLSVPLTYADRFRIRHPGSHWTFLPPHIDGGAIERWEDDSFRRCFEDILQGNWRRHDPYEFEHRLEARGSLYGIPGQTTVFRTFQGWLSLSETGPTQGTLRVFPDIQLSNAYTILRPFFRPTVPLDAPDLLDVKNWKFDISSPEFPGLYPEGSGWNGPQPSPLTHPHLRLDETMTSIPKVNPGDMVFWHCDMIHSVEQEHTGSNDAAVMYIAAVPTTPHNTVYISEQVQTFLKGQNPPDFEQLPEGFRLAGLASDADLKDSVGRTAMGLPIQVA